MRARLRATGLVSLNVYAPGGDRTLAEAVVATLADVFPTVLEFPLAEERVLLAFPGKVAPEQVRALLSGPGVPDELRGVAREAMTALQPAAPGRGAVLTDDRAPVEQLTHEMIARRDRLRAASGRD